MMIKVANPAEVLTSSVNSLREQMRWRASLSRSWSSRLHEPWNHNLHYHRVIIDVIAADCQRALDIGCGQGALTRRLRPLVPEVTGIDRDEQHRPGPQTAGRSGSLTSVTFTPNSWPSVLPGARYRRRLYWRCSPVLPQPMEARLSWRERLPPSHA